MALVAGFDSSTQACKVVVRDAESGELVRHGWAPHPDGTSVDPELWWAALRVAIADAGGIDDVAAISVAAQQHGMICLGEDGSVVRDALLWNDTRSADAAIELVQELGGPRAWASAVGSVPLASFTVTKLRWLASHEPDRAASTAAVCLPHDWLTWRFSGSAGIGSLSTDRSDASGTGYFDPAQGRYRRDLLRLALGHDAVLPSVLGPATAAGTAGPAVLAPGAGDNAAAALGLGAAPGEVIVSIGTSGVASTISREPSADPTGIVAGFASATGDYLPLVCTLNAARVLDVAARLLGVDAAGLDRLALATPPGSGGVVFVPYLDGERTPNRPDASGAVHGLTSSTTPAEVARAAVEGLLCSLADGVDALLADGLPLHRILLIGGGARSAAVRHIAPTIFGRPVAVPPPGEYVADGAARQAAWVLARGDAPPNWDLGAMQTFQDAPHMAVRERYAEVRDKTAARR